MGEVMVGTGPGATALGQYENVACPFCGIHCDDLTISRGIVGLTVVNTSCPKAKLGFERDVGAPSPQIDGQDVSIEAAVSEAARLIAASRLTGYGGLATDVDGMRAVMSLADVSGGVVDHALSDGQYRNFRVLQSGGWVLTTLTEARNRADLFVIVGSNVHTHYPRFFERIVCNDKSMFADAPVTRTVVFLGEGLDQSAAQGNRIGEVISLPCQPEAIGEILVAMRALAKGAPVSGTTIGGLPRAAIENLLARCQAASYAVLVWSSSSLNFANADLTVQALSEFVKDLNLTSRCAGLPLGGNEGSTSASAVCTWQSGFPLRVSFAGGKPEYDSERFAMTHLVTAKDIDVLLWVASYTPDLIPPATDIPMIVLGTPGLKMSGVPRVFIPVGTPGADHAGSVVRCDSAVTLPLRNLHRSQLPRSADVLTAIEAAL